MAQPQTYVTITVTATGSAQNILAVAQAVAGVPANLQGACRELNLQGDPGNSTNNILIGDDTLSATRTGVVLAAGISRNYRSSGAERDIPLSNMFFQASGGSPKLNIEILF